MRNKASPREAAHSRRCPQDRLRFLYRQASPTCCQNSRRCSIVRLFKSLSNPDSCVHLAVQVTKCATPWAVCLYGLKGPPQTRTLPDGFLNFAVDEVFGYQRWNRERWKRDIHSAVPWPVPK